MMKKWLAMLLCVLMLVGSAQAVFAEPDVTELQILMTVETNDDGSLEVSLEDDRGCTVSSWPVYLEVDGEIVENHTTDADGDATFTYEIPEEAVDVNCVAKSGEYASYRFIGCTVYVDRVVETPTTTTPETSSVQATTPVGDSTSASMVVSPLTTTVNDDRVAIGVDVDAAFLQASQLSDTDITSRARLWLDGNLYTSLISGSDATLHLELGIDATAGDQSLLLAAKNADPNYASYADDTVQGFAMTTTLVYVDSTSRVPIEVEDGMYSLELPLPDSLRRCEKIAVAVCTVDGLASFVEVTPTAGTLNFTVQRFQTLAIVGFGNASMSVDSLAQMPWLLTLMIILGVVLIAGGVLILVFVGFRKRKTKIGKEECGEEDVLTTLLTPDKDEAVEEDKDAAIEQLLKMSEESQSAFEETETVKVYPQPKPSPKVDEAPKKPFIEDAPAMSTDTNVKRESATVSEISVDDLIDEVMSDLEDFNI